MWILGTMTEAQHIASALGQAAIAKRLGVGLTAVNNAVSRGKFPAAWFPAVREMCGEAGQDCSESAFNFKSPSTSAPLSEAG